jgi:hypothetical protein
VENDRQEDGRFVYEETRARRITREQEPDMMYMAPHHGAETRMYNTSLIYNPDHEQVLQHHEELLRIAEQERLAQEALKAQKAQRLSSHAQGFLRHLFVRREAREFARPVPRHSVRA